MFSDRREFTNGAFTWKGLGAGQYLVEVFAASFVLRKLVTISATTTDPLSFSLPHTMTLRGRLVDAMSREPLVNYRGTLTRQQAYDFDPVSTDGARFATDADGQFSAMVIAGAHNLDVQATVTHLGVSQSVKIDDADLDLGDVSVARARR